MRTNLVLAAVVAAIAAYAWLAPAPQQDTGFKVIESDDISDINVREQGRVHFRLVRQGGDWKLVEPVALPADAFQVKALLAALRQPASRRYPLADADPAELGLASPTWSVKVDDEMLRLGARAPLGSQRYLQNGESVYLVSDVLSFRLQRAPLDYASKRVLPEGKRVVAIRLPSGMRVVRAKAGWALQPEQVNVSADALQNLVDAWRSATANAISAADSVPHDGEAVVEFGDGGELRFGIEMSDDALKLTRDEPAVTYTLPKAAAAGMLQIEDAMPNELAE